MVPGGSFVVVAAVKISGSTTNRTMLAPVGSTVAVNVAYRWK